MDQKGQKIFENSRKWDSRPSPKYLRTEKILESRPSQKLFENSQNYWIADTAKNSLRTVQNIVEPTSSS